MILHVKIVVYVTIVSIIKVFARRTLYVNFSFLAIITNDKLEIFGFPTLDLKLSTFSWLEKTV